MEITNRWRPVALAAVAVSLLITVGAAAPPTTLQRGANSPEPPRLAVIIVVDQMRADYVERYRNDWTGGLKRLLDEGAWFRNAAYPYLTTVTCAGHATISTGAFPHRHGIFQNAWYERARGSVVTCTADPDVQAIEYDGDIDDGGESGARLLIPSFADEMRRQRGARVATLSLKPRSAIMLAGSGGDAVTWLNSSSDGWETSSAYATAMVPAVKQFLEANRIDADYGKTWTRLLPLERYTGPDDGAGEAPPAGWSATFPHTLAGKGRVDAAFHAQWERSPFANVFLGRFAAALTESLGLGTTDRTDVLGVSFSTPDLVGHAFGPFSHEVQDIYAHLDQTIGQLLARLDTIVGRGRYVVGLSADHGVTTLPEQAKEAGRDGGRLNSSAIAGIIERAAQAAGPGSYVSRVYGNDVYFAADAYERLRVLPAARDRVITRLLQEPGIARVFTREELIAGAASSDRILRAAALSYVPRLSGDLVLSLKPGWMFINSGTTHGSPNPDDQRVPVIFMGSGIKPGVYDDAITPADVTPTLAAVAGIEMPRAEGHPLTPALITGATR